MPESSSFESSVFDSSDELGIVSTEVSFSESISFDIGSVAFSNVLLIGLFVIVILILVRSHK